MGTDNHPLKRTDLKAQERLLRERRAKNFEEQIKLSEETKRRRRDLWEDLAKFIHDNGGWVTSAPHQKVLRIEMPRGSLLQTMLSAYHPRFCSTGTQIQNGEFLPTNTFEIVV